MDILRALGNFLKFIVNLGAPGDTPSGAFLLEENKRLRNIIIKLELENKILKGHHEIEKKISSMSNDEFDDYAKTKISGNKPK